MSAPSRRNYAKSAIIYSHGEPCAEIFVLQQGGVALDSVIISTGKSVSEMVSRGEFFGVKAVLGEHGREETARATSDCVVLVFSIEAFEQLCLQNVRVVLQMLKVFSAQLRRINNEVTEVMGERPEMQETSFHLLKNGEFYYQRNSTEHAQQIYQKYIEYYTDYGFAERAARMCQRIDEGLPFPADGVPLEQDVDARFQQPSAAGTPEAFEPVAQLVHSPGPTTAPPPADTAAPSENRVSSAGEKQDASILYYEGMNHFSQGEFDQAIGYFKQLIELDNFSGQAELKFVEKGHFEIARCLMKKGKKKTAIDKFTVFAKKYAKSELQKKAYFHIAEVYEEAKNPPKAVAYYQKVVKILPNDRDTAAAKKRIAKLNKR